MDIEELKKFAKNKIEADDLTKQVRQRIKETIWEKQNLREGFSETFKPLISQFEKPEDPKTKNIFTQNQEMLRNQLALTEGLRDNQLALTEGLKANQRAITDGFSQFERLADMKELPGNVWEIEEKPATPKVEGGPVTPEVEEDDGEQTGTEETPKKSPTIYDIEKNFNEGELQFLINLNYPRPNEFFDIDRENLKSFYDHVNENEKKLVIELVV